MQKKVAICLNDKVFKHSGNWADVWINYCKKNSIMYDIIDCYHYDIISKLSKYSILLWAYQNYVIADLLEARNIIRVAESLGLKVFPNTSTGWHFDDKIAEMYLLQSVKASIPKNWVFYIWNECAEWLEREAEYPIVAKLRCGSGSSNVKLLHNKEEAIRYAKKMFTTGYDPSPGILYKAFSKIQSTKDWKMFLSRLKRIPEFLNTKSHSRLMPIEKGYCYFQEYIPNDGYDIKVAVVNNKVSYLVRHIRKGDFRASGSGDIYYDNKLMTKNIIESAFYAYNAAKLQCVGFDFVVDSRTGKGMIVEMCYGFDWEAILSAHGYWDADYTWYNKSLNIPEEIIRDILK